MTVYAGEYMEQGKHFSTAGRSVNLYSHVRNQYGVFHRTGNLSTLKSTHTTFGYICTQSMLSHKDTCSIIFIAILFIIASTWKQPRCLRKCDTFTQLIITQLFKKF